MISGENMQKFIFQTHALSLRRAVKGRRKPFDELLKEHRAAKEAMLLAKAELAAASKAIKSGGAPATSMPPGHSKHSDKNRDRHSGGHSQKSQPASNKLAKPQLPMPNRSVTKSAISNHILIENKCQRIEIAKLVSHIPV